MSQRDTPENRRIQEMLFEKTLETSRHPLAVALKVSRAVIPLLSMRTRGRRIGRSVRGLSRRPR